MSRRALPGKRPPDPGLSRGLGQGPAGPGGADGQAGGPGRARNLTCRRGTCRDAGKAGRAEGIRTRTAQERGRRGAFIAVPLPNRYSPIWPRIAELAAAGRLGGLSHAQFRIVNGPPERYRIDGVPWLLAPQTSGGGALRNLGIHGVDAALALAGDDGLELVATSLGHLHGEAVEDYAILTLRDRRGLIVTIEAGYTYASMAPAATSNGASPARTPISSTTGTIAASRRSTMRPRARNRPCCPASATRPSWRIRWPGWHAAKLLSSGSKTIGGP